METQERIDLLNEAKKKLNEGIEMIADALRNTEHESHANAYIIGHLNNWTNGGNPYDYNIEKYIELLSDEYIDQNIRDEEL